MTADASRAPGPAAAAARPSPVALGCLILFALPFAGSGLVAAVLAAKKILAGDWRNGGFLSVFALVFGGAGIGIVAAALAGRRRLERRALAAERHPGEPWLWRPDWAQGRIEDAERRGQYLLWIMAVLWNLVALPTGFAALRGAMEPGNRLALVGLLFPMIGAGLLVAAVRTTWRERKFGVSVLELTTTPGVVGHGLAGSVRVGSTIVPAGGFLATLSCVNARTTGAGKSRSTTETIRWQDQQTVAAQRASGGAGEGVATVIPVRFRIPADVAPTDDTNPDDRMVWRLCVTAAVPGVDYTATFEVPVFRTERSLEPVTGDEEQLLGPPPESLAYRQPPDSPIRVSSGPRGTLIVFPAGRNPGVALALTVFMGLWAGIVWLLWSLKAGLFFVGMFGLVEAVLVYVVLRMWLRVVEVTAGREGVGIASGFGGVGDPRTVPAADIAAVEATIGMQAGTTVYYGLTVVRKDGRRMGAGSGIRDKREAEWLAGLVRRAVGLTSAAQR
ncbi:MAG: hypothetical protein ACM3NS_11455 [Deltaproteobacteria bacterium]